MIILTIWPLFALICLGFLLAWRRFPTADFWPAAERFNYFILFPALLVASLAGAPVRDPALLRLGGAAVAMLCLAAALMLLARWLWPRPVPPGRFGPALQGVIRFNTYLGLAVTAALAGPGGLERAAVVLAVAVPLVNLLSILALSGGGLAVAGRVLKNPLILACLLGLALAWSGVGLPYGSLRVLELMGQASLPLGLLCVGVALRPAALRRDVLAIGANSAVRLLAMPALAAWVGAVFGLGGTEALVLVIFAAIPTAPTAYVLTRQLGGDGTFMAGLVTAQTMAAVVSIPFVLEIFGGQ